MAQIKNPDIIRDIRDALHLDDGKKEQKAQKKVNIRFTPQVFPTKKQKDFWTFELPKIMKTFLKKRLHIGQHSRYVLPELHPYIYGYVNDYSIINLKHTVFQLRHALRVINEVARKNGSFMFVSTKPSHIEFLDRIGDALKMSVITSDRWPGGALTNHPEILKHFKIRLKKDEEFTRSEESVLKGILELKELDLLVVLNPLENQYLLNEARLLGIPVIGLVDTHTPLKGIAYPIVCNNENVVGVFYITRLLVQAIRISKKRKTIRDFLLEKRILQRRRRFKVAHGQKYKNREKSYNKSKQKGKIFNYKKKYS